MRARSLVIVILAGLTVSAAFVALSGTAHADLYPTNVCVSKKLNAAAGQCRAVLAEWSAWEKHQKDEKRDTKLTKAAAILDKKWQKAEDWATGKGVDCSQTTASSSEMEVQIDAAVAGIVTAINTGLDLGNPNHGKCGSKLLKAAAVACKLWVKADSKHVKKPAKDRFEVRRDSARARADQKFDLLWGKAGTCPTTATQEGIKDAVDDLATEIITATTISPIVPDDTLLVITHPDPNQPGHDVQYEGDLLRPRCQDSSAYSFFAKRGTENKLLMYYEGGGACWDTVTCCLELCTQRVDLTELPLMDPNDPAEGFGDLNNPENPFKDWNIVYVPYCSCDVHWGDAGRTYPAEVVIPTLLECDEKHVEHRGHDNAKLAEKWAREHFVNPSDIFVTGSSAGSYGAVMHGISLNEVYPAANINILGDGGNGVITEGFRENQFPNWGVEQNLPDVPGIGDVPVDQQSVPSIIKAAAGYYPLANWAHYTTAYDGGQGGQTGFYHVMSEPNAITPFVWERWWEKSCDFNTIMHEQAVDTATHVAGENDNYRYYIGAGSRHTAFGNDKVYSDTTGGVPRLVDWINAMMSDDPNGWVNVEADPYNVLLPGDPRPDPLKDPFELSGPNTIVNCP
jgi:hypothetical protein